MLGAERNDRRGLRRLQRPTLQYIRPEEEDEEVTRGSHFRGTAHFRGRR